MHLVLNTYLYLSPSFRHEFVTEPSFTSVPITSACYFTADTLTTDDDPRARLTDEQRLYKELLRNYDRNTRPVYNASHPVNVNISISLTQIFDVVSTVYL